MKYSRSIPDSLGNLIQNPFFKQINNEIYPDSMRFNFDTKKALIWNSKSAQSGMNVYAAFTKKENDSVYYIKDAKVTTGGELDDSDYYFRIRKGKMVPQGKIVTGFTNMYIAMSLPQLLYLSLISLFTKATIRFFISNNW